MSSRQKKDTSPFSYRSFRISNYRGINSVKLEFSRNSLILLLGLNESGKTSILKAIEAFDFYNDPRNEEDLPEFFEKMRNRSDASFSGEIKITAEINVQCNLREILKQDQSEDQSEDQGEEADSFLRRMALIKYLSREKRCAISRVICFEDGDYKDSYYTFEDAPEALKSYVENDETARKLARNIINRSAYIIRFEDFQHIIPERIYINEESDVSEGSWYKIIDSLFYDTNEKFSIERYKKLLEKRPEDAESMLSAVNENLNSKFTKQWKELSGVESISEVDLSYTPSEHFFQIKVVDKDHSRYSVAERSKGAIWYIGFLMKTEFRRKKMRSEIGRPVFLIDEPASNLHSTAQQMLLSNLTELARDAYVIYTTHSQYLVSPENLGQVHVVKRRDQKITCEHWGNCDGDDAMHYQPLSDCLGITPHGLDLGWDKALIVEGPSDAAIIKGMYKILHRKDPNFVIYPAGSATKMDILISLNMGWGSKFRILLDNDDEGKKAKRKYEEKFQLSESYFITHPDGRKKIENFFDLAEVGNLWDKWMTHEETPPEKGRTLKDKKKISRIFGAIALSGDLQDVSKMLKKSADNFSALLEKISFAD